MTELLKSRGGLSYNGSHLEPKLVSLPLPNKCDWEIEPGELDFLNAYLIGKDFRHEVNLLVKLRHPNIVQFIGVVTEKKPLMLVTEYLRGCDLHQHRKKKGALNPTTAINFALDIARGLAYLHSEPNVVIHRDLKPRPVVFLF
ncbi:probable serine/threonine-protein kinase ddb_g0271538 [Phtheirospermum japonicum]|uniref:Probable serine/threonine-protein kinase ddb_g0271538 n=1 Tax=Phtheirospermum japonicum TaxID=374723 RepID=A0A830C3U2_9LAMI|nr:probable serine/threonine-protein kinase ddb_g0271538 [Phtheirospermum japonicum]